MSVSRALLSPPGGHVIAAPHSHYERKFMAPPRPDWSDLPLAPETEAIAALSPIKKGDVLPPLPLTLEEQLTTTRALLVSAKTEIARLHATSAMTTVSLAPAPPVDVHTLLLELEAARKEIDDLKASPPSLTLSPDPVAHRLPPPGVVSPSRSPWLQWHAADSMAVELENANKEIARLRSEAVRAVHATACEQRQWIRWPRGHMAPPPSPPPEAKEAEASACDALREENRQLHQALDYSVAECASLRQQNLALLYVRDQSEGAGCTSRPALRFLAEIL